MAKKDKITHTKVKGTTMEFSTLSVPKSLVEDLKLLKESYEEVWMEDGKRNRVTYEKVFERLLSKSGLGHVDPDVYEEYVNARRSRKKLPKVVTRETKKFTNELTTPVKEEENSIRLKSLKEEDNTKGDPTADSTKKTAWFYAHPDGRRYRAELGRYGKYVPLHPETGEYMRIASIGEGFELMEMEI